MKAEDLILMGAAGLAAYLVWLTMGRPSLFGGKAFTPSRTQQEYEDKLKALGLQPFTGLYDNVPEYIDP